MTATPMPRSGPSVRRRVTTAIVAVATVAVLLAGAGTLALARREARRSAADDLASQVEAFGVLVAPTRGPGPGLDRRLRGRLVDAFQLDDIETLTVDPSGTVVRGQLPAGVPVSALGGVAVDHAASGVTGSTVWAVGPVGRREVNGRPALDVVAATRTVPGGLGSAGGWFVLAGGLSIALALAVGAVVARSLTKGVDALVDATSRLADGDLTARAEVLGSGEIADLARSVNAMAADLERRTQSERQFLLSVSHDLRTPLTSITGYAEALADGAMDPDRVAATLQDEARRLERLIGDLLDVARFDAHRFDLHPSRVDLAAVVGSSAGGLESEAARHEITLTVAAEPAQVEVLVDPDRTGQVVANLVENAITFAAAQVRVEVTADEQHGIVRITDDGPGIAPAVRHRVFERLYSSRGDRRRSVGTGLGLTIARELTEAMGGSVELVDHHGDGAVFEARFPLA